VRSIAPNYGVDPALVSAVIKTESNFDRWAVSSKGARGLMQLIPETGRRFGVVDFFDARQNIEGGVRYLRFLLDKFDGNIELSVAAYNAGEGIVERLGRIPPYDETRAYVRRVRQLYPSGPGRIVPEPVSFRVVEAEAPSVPSPAALVRVVLPELLPEVRFAETADAPAAPLATLSAPEEPRIYRTVDEHGAIRFSNMPK
jgi:hypothetical protein